MALYFLSYDLRKQRNYQTLYDELKKFQAVRFLESDWAFKRINTTAAGLRDHFRQFIDADDGLMVSEIANASWAGWKLLGDPNKLP
jgi:hypothetical protein